MRICYFAVKGLLAPHCLLECIAICFGTLLTSLLANLLKPDDVPFVLLDGLVIPLLLGTGSAISESFSSIASESESVLLGVLVNSAYPDHEQEAI